MIQPCCILHLFALMKTISIFGCGWLGMPLARRLVDTGHHVNGSTTTPAKLASLSAEGIRPYLITPGEAEGHADFFRTDTLIVAVPPKLRTQSADDFLNQMQKAATAAEEGTVSNVIFISSTSVYPDINRVVTEQDAGEQHILVKAEQLFCLNRKFSTSVIRFSGLVGPGRHPGKFLAGKKVSGGSNPVNIIHLDDCIKIIERLMHKPGLVINGCADYHPTKRAFYSQAARSLNLDPPLFDDAQSPYKIVSNELLKKELDYRFTFPDPMTMKY